jgi:crotonobetainyl-CoA:carnitine CoA-transferase CaiB-like acyl-CoA transferase
MGLADTFLETIGYPGSRGIPIAKAPARLSNGTAESLPRPPLLGEHSEIVLEEYGFKKDEIEALQRDGVI